MRSLRTSSSFAAASTPIRPPASLKVAFSIGFAAMNSLQRSMMRRDVVALVVAGEERHVRRGVVRRHVLRRLRRRRAGEEDEERLADVAHRVRDDAPLRLQLVEHHVDGAQDVGEREAVADVADRARGSAGTSPSCAAPADPSWRRGRSPRRRRSAARRRRTCPGCACARRCRASPRRRSGEADGRVADVSPRIEVQRRPPSASAQNDHRRRSCPSRDRMWSVNRSIRLRNQPRSRARTTSGRARAGSSRRSG